MRDMQIEIISGPPASGKTTRLRQLEQQYQDAGKAVLHIHSDFTLAYIRRRIILAGLQGYAAVLLDDCSKDKLKKLVRAQKEIEERMDFDLHLYAVECA
jgi:tRNA uridine 5-carbamoylmethylation protein Kti12